jgi:tetratricopeptide (TPR) repeat protein
LAKGFIAKEEEEFELAETYYKNALKVGGSVTCYEKLLELYLDRTNEPHKAKDLLEEAKKTHPNTNWSSFVSKFS